MGLVQLMSDEWAPNLHLEEASPSVDADGPIEHPTEANRLGPHLGRTVLSQLLHPAYLARQPAHVVLRAPPLAGQAGAELRHLPPAHEVLHHVGVVRRRVHPRALRNRREVIEEALVAAVVHELAGHGDLGAHHGGERPHHAVLVVLEGPGGGPGVGCLVAPLVGRDDAAELGEAGVAVEARLPGGAGVGDEGGALLEGAVDEAVVRAGGPQHGAHAAAEEVVHRRLDAPHVHAAAQVEVAVEQVAVAVLLGGPAAQPARPAVVVAAGGVAAARHAVGHGHVAGQALLRDHAAHEADEEVVGHASRTGLELRHLAPLLVGGDDEGGQQVGRLPGLLHGGEQRQHMLVHPPVLRQAPHHHLFPFLLINMKGSCGCGGHRRRCRSAPAAAAEEMCLGRRTILDQQHRSTPHLVAEAWPHRHGRRWC